MWFLSKSASFMKMFLLSPNGTQVHPGNERHPKPGSDHEFVVRALIATSLFAVPFSVAMYAQQADSAKPVVVQPGAPGMPSKTLSPSARGVLPPRSAADVEFMQGMILHHAQAVEMTAMIPSHTQNEDLRSLGARISSSQSDEIKFMDRWLAARGESVPKPMAKMPGMDMPDESSQASSHQDSMA